MRKVYGVALAVTALAAGACATLGRQYFRQPAVTVQDVAVSGLGINGGSLDVLLNVQNPNDYRLDATRLTYQVLVDTVHIASGLLPNGFHVDGKGTQQVKIPVNFTYAGLGEAGRRMMNNGTVPYTVSGDITVGSVVGNFTVPFQQSGRITSVGGVSR